MFDLVGIADRQMTTEFGGKGPGPLRKEYAPEGKLVSEPDQSCTYTSIKAPMTLLGTKSSSCLPAYGAASGHMHLLWIFIMSFWLLCLHCH